MLRWRKVTDKFALESSGIADKLDVSLKVYTHLFSDVDDLSSCDLFHSVSVCKRRQTPEQLSFTML